MTGKLLYTVAYCTVTFELLRCGLQKSTVPDQEPMGLFVAISLAWLNLLPASRLVGIYYYTTTTTFNGLFSRTTRVSRYQKGKTNLHFTGARDSEWQWHQPGHIQVCTSLQTDKHASTPPLCFYRPDALPATQPTASKHWRHSYEHIYSPARQKDRETEIQCEIPAAISDKHSALYIFNSNMLRLKKWLNTYVCFAIPYMAHKMSWEVNAGWLIPCSVSK